MVLADDQTTARRVEETRRDFVANTSHELKTPIGAISLLAEAVEDAADDPQAVRRFASRMGIESARLADLVEPDHRAVQTAVGQPAEHVRRWWRSTMCWRRLSTGAGWTPSARRDPDHCGTAGSQVLGSARQLGVAVGNLVENAVVYSDAGARVVVAAHVQARSDDDYVEITVSDNGIGIPPAERPDLRTLLPGRLRA